MFKYLILLIASFTASADQTAGFSWDAPTQRIDGTPLAIDEITGYNIYYRVGDSTTAQYQVLTSVTSGTAANAALSLPASPEPITVYFYVTALVGNLESDPSNIQTKTFIVKSTSRPLPPVLNTISINCNAGCVIEVVK